MQRLYDSFELGTVNSQAFLPRPQGRLARLAHCGFVKHTQKRATRLRVRCNLLQQAFEITINVSAHQLVNVKTLTVEKRRQRGLMVAGRLDQSIDEQRTGAELLHD